MHDTITDGGMASISRAGARRASCSMKRRASTVLWLTFLCASSSSSHGFLAPNHPFGTIRPVVVGPQYHHASLGTTEREKDDDASTKYAGSSQDTRRRRPAARKSRRIQLASKLKALTELEEQQDQVFFALAILPSFLAFFAWKDISSALACVLETYGVAKQDFALDFSNNLLRPTITGVVVPIIAIALATLSSTTINVLRDREVQLRTLINKEACDLHLLRQAVFGLFGTRQHASRRAKALALLCSYVEQLERESSLGAIEKLQDLQLSGGIAANELNQLTQMLHGIDGAAASRQGSVGYADDLIRSLNDYRSERVAELLSGFPAIHWGVLIMLSLSACTTFLLASNQPKNEFYLDSISLRYLFATLVGVCSGTATLCINLADPFRGTFSVLDASAQLGELRLGLERDIAEATREAGEISSSLVHAILLGETEARNGIVARSTVPPKNANNRSLDRDTATGRSRSGSYGKLEAEDWDWQQAKIRKDPRRRYGLVPTLYFHLLTGPFGSNAKALGEILAWVATFVTKQTKLLSRRINMAFGRKRRWGLRWRHARNNGPSSSIESN